MQTFIMLTKLARDSLRSPEALERLDKKVMNRILSGCVDVEWVERYVVLGPYDHVDIFRAPDVDAALKVATCVRTFGHAQTEVWPATGWKDFLELIRHMPPGDTTAV